MSYARLRDMEEKSTIYPLRIAFSFLASAAALSLVAVRALRPGAVCSF